MNQGQRKHTTLLRKAFDEYLVIVHENPLQPDDKLLSYDFNFLNNRKWNGVAETMVSCDLRELTNLINGWNNSLGRWHAWGLVLNSRDEDEAWALRSEFLDSLAHECLLLPSSIRDTLVSVATAAFHQVRLGVDQSYPDFLQGDPKTPDEKPKQLNRKQKEKRLSNIIQIWPESARFLDKLRNINTPNYIDATYDYRNLTSHTIAPRLGIGQTRTVTRCIKPASTFKKNKDGELVRVDIPDKMSVCYGFGGTPPLDLETVRKANLTQYQNALSCYIEYRALLQATVAKIASLKSDSQSGLGGKLD